tara:strand:- start:12499 stop:13332 length:834 start_codon:yes stop_codon:yes gene_type:complete
MKKYKKKINNAENSRFYRYQDFRDKLFLVIANPIAYLFYKLGLSANMVSLASGLIAIVGSILLSSKYPLLIFCGSLCMPLFYLLDYVDGIVARLNSKQSVGGQYLDLIMHQVVVISISFGLFVGSLRADGEIMIPFGLLSIIASSFLLNRFSIGWFAIIMKYFEQKSTKGIKVIRSNQLNKKKNIIISILSRLGSLLFHEDYAIFSLPLIFFFNIFFHEKIDIDLRSIMIIYGALILFPAMILDIIFYTNNKIDRNYNNLIENEFKPKLPDVFYFKK